MSFTAVRLPIQDMTGHLMTRQSKYDRCRDFEYRFIQCAEAYGIPKAATKCKDYFDDLGECQFKTKQIMRIQAMEKERIAQYKRGEREEKYEPDPRHDVWNLNREG